MPETNGNLLQFMQASQLIPRIQKNCSNTSRFIEGIISLHSLTFRVEHFVYA